MPRFAPGLAFLGALAVASPVRADASLTAASVEIGEGEYQLSIDVHGLTASVELRQTIVNLGQQDTEAFYDFQLPADAVLDGITVGLPGRPDEPAFGADAVAAGTPTTGEAASGQPDVALLARGLAQPTDAGDAVANYRLSIYPLPAGKAVSLRTHWVMPITYADGRILIALPDRGDAANLSHESGVLRFHPLPGISDYEQIHADGVVVANSAGGRALAFGHTRRHGLAIEATPRFASADPIAWVTPIPLDARRGALAVQIMVPRVTASAALPFDRVLAVVDTSRSMEGAQDSAAHVLEAVLAAAKPTAEIDAIFFDRAARGGAHWRPNTAANRAAIAAELRAASLENGTGLPEAMSQAGAAIGDPPEGLDADRRRTLVVAITDGLLPSETTALELVQRFGGVHADRQLSFVLLAPPGAGLPDALHGPIADAASQTGGMTIAARAEETALRARALAAELGQPAPLRELAATGLDQLADFALPDVIASGQGISLLGWYQGRAPAAARITAVRGDRPVQLAPRRVVAADLTPIAIARASEAITQLTFTREATGVPTEAETAEASALVAAAQRRARTVTDATSLVVVDRRAPFVAERKAMAAKGGPFTRIAPTTEIAAARSARPPQVQIG
ncbi:MAG: hypothetical protein K8W52_27155, partial [Deltaproteobacteria bacterium]|nr:hypothetical protein [Deltaproteobacteria bacterium]